MIEIIKQKEVTFDLPKKDISGVIVMDKDGNEVTEKHGVIMKRLSYGEKVDLEEEAMEIKIIGNNPITKVSSGKLRILSIVKSIVKSDLPAVDYNAIRNLPQEVGGLLFQTFIELNSTNPQSKT